MKAEIRAMAAQCWLDMSMGGSTESPEDYIEAALTAAYEKARGREWLKNTQLSA